MRKLLILVMLMMPIVANASVGGMLAGIPVTRVFLSEDDQLGMSEAQSDCFYEKWKVFDCAVVTAIDGVLQNPEDEPAARECQELALAACKAEISASAKASGNDEPTTVPDKLNCDDGSDPSEAGCCPGETPDEINGMEVCCPEGEGDCFPALK